MAKRLERVSEFAGGLFDQPQHQAQSPPSKFPKCAACSNRGFVNCPEAITDHGDLIVRAFEYGTACSCPAGAEFAKFQMEWMS